MQHQNQSKPLCDTGLSYRTTFSTQNKENQSQYFQKENIVPCSAQLQSLISTLTQKKHTLKHLQIQKENLRSATLQQDTLIQKEKIKQDYQYEMEESLLKKNNHFLDQIKKTSTDKMMQMQNMITLKKSLEDKYNQIMAMKSYLMQLKSKQQETVENIRQMETKNHQVTSHNSDLSLMLQTMNNEVYDAKQAVRLSQVQNQTTVSAYDSLKGKIKQCLKQHSQKNKQGRDLTLWLKEETDRLAKMRDISAENQMRSSEYKIRNGQIQQVNKKLRGDLQKCQNHLKCLLKNNELLTNSIEQFSFADQQITRLINRHDLQKL